MAPIAKILLLLKKSIGLLNRNSPSNFEIVVLDVAIDFFLWEGRVFPRPNSPNEKISNTGLYNKAFILNINILFRQFIFHRDPFLSNFFVTKKSLRMNVETIFQRMYFHLLAPIQVRGSLLLNGFQ